MARTDDTPAIPEFSSPFMDDGKCWSCGGYGEHFRDCPYATWERRVL